MPEVDAYQPNVWQRSELSIPAELRTSEFQLRFVYSSGVAYPTTNDGEAMQHTAPGWYLDDLSIEIPN